MKGSKFLKVTGILMIIGSAMVILLGVIVAGFGALVAGIGGYGFPLGLPAPVRR